MTDRGRAMDDSPLDRFHRQRRRELVLRRLPLLLLAVAVGGGMTWVFVTQPANGPAASAVAAGATSASASATATATATATAAGTQSGTLLAGPASAVPSGEVPSGTSGTPATPPPAQQSFSIAVATRGFQAELDRCEWVRMDVGAVAPIVGAHNFCDGDVVLAMNVGDLVAITGTDLDGDFQVTGSRDAHAGDDAAAATSGLTADLLLQTCYWTGDALRLVTLRRVDLSLAPTPAPSG